MAGGSRGPGCRDGPVPRRRACAAPVDPGLVGRLPAAERAGEPADNPGIPQADRVADLRPAGSRTLRRTWCRRLALRTGRDRCAAPGEVRAPDRTRFLRAPARTDAGLAAGGAACGVDDRAPPGPAGSGAPDARCRLDGRGLRTDRARAAQRRQGPWPAAVLPCPTRAPARGSARATRASRSCRTDSAAIHP